MTAADEPTHLAYRLEPADLSRFLASGRRCACRDQCGAWAWSLALLAPIVIALALALARSGGVRSILVAIASASGTLGLIALAREAIAARRCRAMARDLGLPREVRVVISPEGIAPEPDADGTGRVFAWSDVAEVARRGGVTAIRLRVAGTALLIPDRVFASPADRMTFEGRLAELSSGS